MARTSDRIEEIAAELFPILINMGKRGEVIFYGDAGKRVGINHQFKGRTVAQALKRLYRWCEQRHLPALTAVVVSKRTREAGEWLTDRADPKTERDRVARYDWASVRSPAATELTDKGE